ncbi:MAG TPA: hypothetical protein VGE02_08985 [Gemmatimonadales bacterium]
MSPRHLAARLGALVFLLLTACSALEPEYAGVVVRYREAGPLTRERLVVTLESHGITWYLEGTDMAADGGWLSSRVLRIPKGGQAELVVALRGQGSQPAATGTVALPLEVGRQARVDVFISEEPLELACDGCAGLARFPIQPAFRPSARDWLYVRWTGTASVAGPIVSTRRAQARPAGPDMEQR